ncbi:hypothetical protein ElyMa_004215200 [Elysia marginata]|uniref:Uncharacterized protein n=1 Tax=Elysia marginata TaxID=1093978 RepID=A0AAV4GNL5_9GAST|nr:hypothetical protein ElyMa_004215200 [Elysia marginata]
MGGDGAAKVRLSEFFPRKFVNHPIALDWIIYHGESWVCVLGAGWRWLSSFLSSAELLQASARVCLGCPRPAHHLPAIREVNVRVPNKN